MKKYDSILLKGFLISSLPVWAIIIAAFLRGSADDWFNDTAAALLFLWLLSFMYMLGKMLFVQNYRESLLATIFHQKVADEREELLSGQASKRTYFFSVAIILALLFLSTVKISMVKPSDEARAAGEKGQIMFGLGYSLTSKEAIKLEKNEFSIKELPLSKEGILSLMLLLQLVSYHMNFRKRIGLEG